MSYRIQLRRDKAAFWAQENPILADGELGWVSDSRELKIGDGVTPFNDLPNIIPQEIDLPEIQESIPEFNSPQDLEDPAWFQNLNPGDFFILQEYESDVDSQFQGVSLNRFVGINDADPLNPTALYTRMVFVPDTAGQGPNGLVPPGGSNGQVLMKANDDDYEFGWSTLQAEKSGESIPVPIIQQVESTAENMRVSAAGNGIFLIAGRSQGQADLVFTSTDGLEWTQQTTPAGLFLLDAAFGNGIFVLVGTGTFSPILTSTDGETWTVRGDESIYSGLYAVVYSEDHEQFVAIGYSSVYTSPDGITWTEHAGSPGAYWNSVAYGNGKYVAVGPGGKTMISENGTDWSFGPDLSSEQFLKIIYGGALFVAITSEGSIYTSETGDSNWVFRYRMEGATAIAYGNGYYLAFGFQGTDGAYLVSDNGRVWQPFSNGGQQILTIVHLGNGAFAGAGISGFRAGQPTQYINLDEESGVVVLLNRALGTFYGSDSPVEGDFYVNFSGAVLGGFARVKHNSATEPLLLGDFEIEVQKGSYLPNEDNFIEIKCTEYETAHKVEVEFKNSASQSSTGGGSANSFPVMLADFTDFTEVVHSGDPQLETFAEVGEISANKLQDEQVIDLNVDYVLKPQGSVPLVRLKFLGKEIMLPSGSLPAGENLYIKANIKLILIPDGSDIVINSIIKASSYTTFNDDSLADDVVHFPGDYLGNDTYYVTGYPEDDQVFEFAFQGVAGSEAKLVSAIGYSRVFSYTSQI